MEEKTNSIHAKNIWELNDSERQKIKDVTSRFILKLTKPSLWRRIKRYLTFKIFRNNNSNVIPNKNTNQKISEMSFPLYQSLRNFDPEDNEKTETGKRIELAIRGSKFIGGHLGSYELPNEYFYSDKHNDYP